jgi:hypothetical protein
VKRKSRVDILSANSERPLRHREVDEGAHAAAPPRIKIAEVACVCDPEFIGRDLPHARLPRPNGVRAMPPPRRHPLNPRAQRIRGGRHERAVSRGHNAQGLAGLERRIPHPIDNLRAKRPESGGSAPCGWPARDATARLVWRSPRGRRAVTVPPYQRSCIARRDRRKAKRRSWTDHPAAGRLTAEPTSAADEGNALRRPRRRARLHLPRKNSDVPCRSPHAAAEASETQE